MAGSTRVGISGAGGYTLEVDEGTLARTASPQQGLAGATAAALGDPPLGHLRAMPMAGWLLVKARDILKHTGRFGNRARMTVGGLAGLQAMARTNWREACTGWGPAAEITLSHAMEWERLTELIAFLQSPRGKLTVEIEAFLERPAGDMKQRYVTLNELFRRHFGLLRQEQLLGIDTPLDEDEIQVMDQVYLEMLRATNEVAKAEIPKLRREFWMASRRSPADSIEDRNRQRSMMLKVTSGVDEFESQAPRKRQEANGAADPESLFPHCLADIMKLGLSIERQEQLMGGFIRGDDPLVKLDFAQAREDLEATMAEASHEFHTMQTEEAYQGLQDAKRRIATFDTLKGVDKLKAQTMIEYDLSFGIRALLGMERQRQLLGMTDATSGSFGGIDLSWTKAESQMKRIAIDAEKLYSQWKGTAPTAFVSTMQFLGDPGEAEGGSNSSPQ